MLDMVVQTFNSSTWEAEAVSYLRVQSQPGVHSKLQTNQTTEQIHVSITNKQAEPVPQIMFLIALFFDNFLNVNRLSGHTWSSPVSYPSPF